MIGNSRNYPVGARVLIRDEEWRIAQVDPVRQGGCLLTCDGISGLVQGVRARFFTEYEDRIEILLPEQTRLVADSSSGFIKSKLYLEALFRTAPKTDRNKIYVANRAAMDPMPYQFDPAIQALSQPQPRILIADAVGIGKTLEAGILTSELIARGRGKRILVIVTKAMLSQFQQEFWNRFTIPLVMLDSAGISRIENRIPAGQNPFLYYDRTIISVDTLKRDDGYRANLEKAHWDIIIIDEAHNVAERRTRSYRSRLAQTLESRSDAMILLTATPHDGRAESFASLLNILDSTAIANPKDYRLSDFADKGLVIRRFKSDVRDQVQKEFPDREVLPLEAQATPEEDAVYAALDGIRFNTLDTERASGAHLFATTLRKAMFSSPAACRKEIENRLGKLGKKETPEAAADAGKLKGLLPLVDAVTPEKFSKFSLLVRLLGKNADPVRWNRAAQDDRIVIFTESIPTLDFLKEELPKRLGLKEKQVAVLKGSMKDSEISAVVDDFNKAEKPVRLLLASDVASEGLNLHHFSHRMIHFDLPWSLLVFQQRNGRIDRYGQTETPQIIYLQTISSNPKAFSDARILEKLREKDTQAQKNLDDPAEFFLSQEEQEDRTCAEMEGREVEELEEPFDFFGELEKEDEGKTNDGRNPIAPVMSFEDYGNRLARLPSLFASDRDFAWKALSAISSDEVRQGKPSLGLSESEGGRLRFTAPKDLQARLRHYLPEALPKDWRFDLTDNPKAVEREIYRVRGTDEEWPETQLLWPLHPVFEWIESRTLNAFGRHSAPVLSLDTIPRGETWVLLQGGYPNRRGFTPVHRWLAYHDCDRGLMPEDLGTLIRETRLGESLSNAETALSEEAIREIVSDAVVQANRSLRKEKDRFLAEETPKQEERLRKLAALKRRHEVQLELDFADGLQQVQKKRREDKKMLLEKMFASAEASLRDSTQLEEKPYIQLAAVFISSAS